MSYDDDFESRVLKSARMLDRLGLAIHRLRVRQKAPVKSDWPNAPRQSFADFESQYRRGENIGVRLGQPSETGTGRFWMVLDFDVNTNNPQQVRYAKETLFDLLPELDRAPCVISGSGGESRHFYFQCDRALRSKVIAQADDTIFVGGKRKPAWSLEIYGTGKQVVAPPSIHPETGEEYAWLQKPTGKPPLVHAERLSSFYQAEASADYTDEPAIFSDPEREIAAILDAIPQTDIESYHGWLQTIQALHHQFDGDEEGLDWALYVSERASTFDPDEIENKWRSFGRYNGPAITMRSLIAKYHDQMVQAEIEDLYAADDAEPDAEDPPSLLEPVERRGGGRFPLEVLPAFWQREIKALCAETNCGPEWQASLLLAVAGGMIGNSAWANPKPSWAEPPVLNVVLLAPSGAGKTPALTPWLSMMSRIEKDVKASLEPAVAENEFERQVAIRRAKAFDKRRDAAIDAYLAKSEISPDDAYLEFETGANQRPMIPEPLDDGRILVSDVTPERLTALVALSSKGLVLFMDEISSLAAMVAGYSDNNMSAAQSTGRSHFLKLNSGQKIIVDRVGDGKSITCERGLTTCIGGLQTDIRHVIYDRKADGFGSRFTPVMRAHGTTPSSSEPFHMDLVQQALRRLRLLSAPNRHNVQPERVPFSEEASQAFNEIIDELRPLQHEAVARYGWYDAADLVGFASKAAGMVARVALILEHLEWAADVLSFDPVFSDEPPREISVDAVEDAYRVVMECFWPCAEKAMTGGPQSTFDADALAVARQLKEWPNARIGERDLNSMMARTGAAANQATLHILITQRHVLRPIKADKNDRNSERQYRVNRDALKHVL